MMKEEKELREVIKKIEGLEVSFKSQTDFFKQKFIKDEIKKYNDKKDSLENKIRHLEELAGELRAPVQKEEEKQDDGASSTTEASAQVDDKDLISGPCHELISTAGGKGQSEIHYFAREVPGENRVKLEYLAPTGKSTGLHAKTVSKEDYLKKYFSCIEHGCDIVKN